MLPRPCQSAPPSLLFVHAHTHVLRAPTPPSRSHLSPLSTRSKLGLPSELLRRLKAQARSDIYACDYDARWCGSLAGTSPYVTDSLNLSISHDAPCFPRRQPCRRLFALPTNPHTFAYVAADVINARDTRQIPATSSSSARRAFGCRRSTEKQHGGDPQPTAAVKPSLSAPPLICSTSRHPTIGTILHLAISHPRDSGRVRCCSTAIYNEHSMPIRSYPLSLQVPNQTSALSSSYALHQDFLILRQPLSPHLAALPVRAKVYTDLSESATRPRLFSWSGSPSHLYVRRRVQRSTAARAPAQSQVQASKHR
ncbi:hypothetical protein C8R43DRAFT_1235244 [Mycena crocata]|nr:hypothetical protein C8R43DRAFT_1235244 [Mycena crocata]